MIWLYILLGIILFVALIMLLPIRLYALYSDALKCVLYVGFVKFQIYPSKPKKKKEKKKIDKEQKNEETKEDKKSLVKEKGAAQLIDMIKRAANLAGSALKDFFSHILIKKLSLSINVAGSDAAEAAINYGKYCAAVYPAISIITSSVKCSDYGVDIIPDFDEKAKTQVEFELIARVFVFRLVGLVLRHGFKAIKLLAELRNP